MKSFSAEDCLCLFGSAGGGRINGSNQNRITKGDSPEVGGEGESFVFVRHGIP